MSAAGTDSGHWQSAIGEYNLLAVQKNWQGLYNSTGDVAQAIRWHGRCREAAVAVRSAVAAPWTADGQAAGDKPPPYKRAIKAFPCAGSA